MSHVKLNFELSIQSSLPINLAWSTDRMKNGEKPQRKEEEGPSVSCIQGQQCYPFWNSMKQASVFSGVWEMQASG